MQHTNNLLEISKFVAPEIIFGFEAISQTGESALRLGAKKIFLVTDHGIIQSGWIKKVIQYLNQVDLDYQIWSNLTSNPKDYEILDGLNHYISSSCDAIIAIGGGSSIDAAKAIAVLATNGGELKDFEGINKVTKPLPPMIILPTTGGSGSEVSQFAIIVDTERKIKMTIVSKSLVPDIAIVDPILLNTLDSRLTAATGVDTLCHAIEAYVSLAATPLTDVHALQAIQLVANNIRESMASHSNLSAKNAMAMASLQAGLAFSNAILGVTHAMAHQIDGLLDTHHGETNGILLPHVMEFNLLANPTKFADIAQALGANINNMSTIKAAEKAPRWVANLLKDIGIPHSLAAIGLKKEVIPHLAENALKDACIVTNPRDVDKDNVNDLFTKAF